MTSWAFLMNTSRPIQDVILRRQRRRNATTLAAKEDLNFNRIVSKQFDRAAQYLKIHPALLGQIKACKKSIISFPVRFGGDKYEIFEAGAPNTPTTKACKRGYTVQRIVNQDEIMALACPNDLQMCDRRRAFGGLKGGIRFNPKKVSARNRLRKLRAGSRPNDP